MTVQKELRDPMFGVALDIEGDQAHVDAIGRSLFEIYMTHFCRLPDEQGYVGYLRAILSGELNLTGIQEIFVATPEYEKSLIQYKLDAPDADGEINRYIEESKIFSKAGFRIYAPIGTSGYANASYDYINGLVRNGAAVSFYPIDRQGPLPKGDNDRWLMVRRSLYRDIKYENVIIFANGEIQNKISKIEHNKKVYRMFVWETSVLPRHTKNLMKSSVGTTIAPSQFNLEIFKKQVDRNSRVVHHVIPLPALREKLRGPQGGERTLDQIRSLAKDKYIFYTIAQWNARKDLLTLIKAYDDAFSGSDETALVVKTFLNGFGEAKNQILRELVAGLCESRNIVLVFEDMSERQIEELHSLCHCYVSCSRGEGVGIPIIQAARQNPVVAPKYSGYMDYIKEINAIDYKMAKVDVSYPPYGEFFKAYYPDYDSRSYWAQVDPTDLSRKLKTQFETRAPAKLANRLFINFNFNTNAVAGEWYGLLNEIDEKLIQNIFESFLAQQITLDHVRGFVFQLDRLGLVQKFVEICRRLKKKNGLSDFVVVYQYYRTENQDRQMELDICLENMLLNPLIDEVHILAEDKYQFNSKIADLKLKQIPIGNRLTFQTALQYCNDKLDQKICAIINADIYLGASIAFVEAGLEHAPKTMMCISRHDYVSEYHQVESYTRTNDAAPQFAQDTWIFKSPIEIPQNVDFYQGRPGCDNRLAYLFLRENYYVFNPADTITTVHMHSGTLSSHLRNKENQIEATRFRDEIIPVWPIGTSDIASIFELSRGVFQIEPSSTDVWQICKQLWENRQAGGTRRLNVLLSMASIFGITNEGVAEEIACELGVTLTSLDVRALSKRNSLSLSEFFDQHVRHKSEFWGRFDRNSTTKIEVSKLLERAFRFGIEVADRRSVVRVLLASGLKKRLGFELEPNLIEKILGHVDGNGGALEILNMGSLDFSRALEQIFSAEWLVERAYVAILDRLPEEEALIDKVGVIEREGIEAVCRILRESEEAAIRSRFNETLFGDSVPNAGLANPEIASENSDHLRGGARQAPDLNWDDMSGLLRSVGVRSQSRLAGELQKIWEARRDVRLECGTERSMAAPALLLWSWLHGVNEYPGLRARKRTLATVLKRLNNKSAVTCDGAAETKPSLKITHLMMLIWYSRPDLQSVYRLDQGKQYFDFCCWFVVVGANEFKLQDVLSPEQREFQTSIESQPGFKATMEHNGKRPQ